MKNDLFFQLFIEFAPRELWGAILSLQGSEGSSAVKESEVLSQSENTY